MQYKIVVVGCGPKGLAIYAKAKALQAAGMAVPEVTLIEKSSVAAHWSGQNGYTDGYQALGTPPEKDIGYPYNSEYKKTIAPDIDSFLFKLSWPAYQISAGHYASWTDRDRPAPQHREWAKYLNWVKEKLKLDHKNLVHGDIKNIQEKNKQWHVVTYAFENEQEVEIVCDAIVFTGPGEPKRFRTQSTADIVMDGQNFWKPANLTWIRDWRTQKKRFAVIGTGETAASVIGKLIDLDRESMWEINVISRGATLYSRGEGYHENRFFSDPTNWPNLTMPMRRELIARTDRGVLSQKAIRAIAGAENVVCKNGEVHKILTTTAELRDQTSRSTPDAQARVYVKDDQKPWMYDCVVVAMGFDAFSFAKYFVNKTNDDLAPLYNGRGRPDPSEPGYSERVGKVAEKIGFDLSVHGMEPRLYLPMFAGLMQGPGFPNLSCLGLLSDRILRHGVELLNQKKASNV